MKKKLVSVLLAAGLAAMPVTVMAEATDYSYLEDMSVKELKALSQALFMV